MTSSMNIVIVGANAAGAKAASRIRRLDPAARITILEQSEYFSYAGCALPYCVSGTIPAIDELIKTPYGTERDAAYFRKTKNIEVLIGRRVEKIDRKNKTVRAHNLDTGQQESYAYDRLVLAMGAAPITPPVEGADLRGIYHLTRMEDAEALVSILAERPGGSAVIVGAGFIGMEAAEALAERKWDVTVIERYDQVFPWALDFEMAAFVQEHCFEHMVEFELGAEVVRFEGDDNGQVVRVVTAKETYDADLVILATGMRPNVDLARAAGLKIGETGALAVDEYLRTSDPDIFAGGDLVENVHRVTGKKCYIPLGSTANKHGRVIADNVCGLQTRFPGVAGTFVCKVFDVAVGSTGLSENAAVKAGLDIESICAPGFDKAHYYPDSAMLGLKVVSEKGSGRLLGLQAVGRGDVARRIDVVATVIHFGGTLEDLVSLDLAYAPPYSQALDCLITAAHAARNASAGLLHPIDQVDVHSLLEGAGDFVLLDLRSPNEFVPAHIDDRRVVNIPLDELGERLGELPRDRKILCMCSAGLRGYSAQRMLEAAGFSDVSTIEGGMFLWPWKDELA